ncbi:hypothetical protein [Streptomyces tauricus]|uniref:hypothetical protein n=1 Tax=Streptomyces tauricus TaxID=68274 RepID=UPI002244C5D7|nr:hypothetical protein [Streptomyces tauricus]MCW8102574.1 hypothetical protein [Streptomyces tauricus]
MPEGDLVAPGGLRVHDTLTGFTFLPACCDGLESWRDWHRFADDGNLLAFGHDPVSPVAVRFGDTVRLTVNADQRDSPVIVLSVTEHRRLLAGAEGGAAPRKCRLAVGPGVSQPRAGSVMP